MCPIVASLLGQVINDWWRLTGGIKRSVTNQHHLMNFIKRYRGSFTYLSLLQLTWSFNNKMEKAERSKEKGCNSLD